jgi:peptidoglycan/xylan/chitin deacetylase (PgdA/CDA1 family)
MDSAVLLRAGFDALYFSGLAKATRSFFRGRGAILCLHHVRPDTTDKNGFKPNARLEVTPEFLGSIIELVRERGFETVSLGEAVRRIESPKPNDKPFAVFTLDDGYKDNQIFAQPVFDRMECPFTIFVAPGIIDGSCELWWRGIELVIAKTLNFKAVIAGQKFDHATATTKQKYAVYKKAAALLLNMPQYEQRETIRQIAAYYHVDLSALCKESAMTWDEIRVLNADPLCTIGAHTMGHYAVAKLDTADARYQMQQSRIHVAKELDELSQFFAYPYGDETAARPRDFKIAQNIGFTASVTTRKGMVHKAHAKHLQSLPRIMVSGRYQKLRYVDVLLSGLPMAIVNRFRKLNIS